MWLTGVDCAESEAEFQPYLDIIRPQHILAMHFDGLMPDIEQGLEESFQEPEWYTEAIQNREIQSLYPTEYFERITVKERTVQ